MISCCWLLFFSLFCVMLTQLVADWKRSTKLSMWYTNFDMCILSNSSTLPVETIINDCETKSTLGKETLKPLRCQVGNSWPSKSGFCSSADIPFTERGNLFNAYGPYDDPSQSPLKVFFAQLASEKGSLLLIGDSVMQQFYSAMACELEREGVWRDPNQFTNTDEIMHVQVHADYGVPIKFVPIYHFVNSRFDRIANASMYSLKKSIDHFTKDHDSLVVILNMGLHYVSNPIPMFSRTDYQSQLTEAFQYLHSLHKRYPTKKLRIVWRETSAQHFPTPNGYWPGQKYSGSMKLACAPISDPSPQADWRNSDIAQIIRKHKFNIEIMPFYNASVALWNMHVNGYKQDCTHFCWTPMLYQPLFHYMMDLVKVKQPSP